MLSIEELPQQLQAFHDRATLVRRGGGQGCGQTTGGARLELSHVARHLVGDHDARAALVGGVWVALSSPRDASLSTMPDAVLWLMPNVRLSSVSIIGPRLTSDAIRLT